MDAKQNAMDKAAQMLGAGFIFDAVRIDGVTVILDEDGHLGFPKPKKKAAPKVEPAPQKPKEPPSKKSVSQALSSKLKGKSKKK